MWIHVDGAYGAPAAAAPTTAPLLAGIERADSLVIDPHKWLFLPKAVGCVCARPRALDRGLRRRGGLSRERRRALRGAGLAGLAGHRGHASLPRTRPLDGVHGLRRRCPRRGDRERPAPGALLADAVRAAPDLELLDEPQLSIVVYRHRPPGWTNPSTSTLTTARCSTRCSATAGCSRRPRRSAACSRCAPASRTTARPTPMRSALAEIGE